MHSAKSGGFVYNRRGHKICEGEGGPTAANENCPVRKIGILTETEGEREARLQCDRERLREQLAVNSQLATTSLPAVSSKEVQVHGFAGVYYQLPGLRSVYISAKL